MSLGRFIGTAIGGLFGGGTGNILAKGIGGILGEKSDNRRAEKKNAYNDSQRFVRLRAAAEAGGFHPLEALRAGGTAPVQSQPRLMSNTAAANAFDYIEQYEKQQRDALQRAEDKAEAKRNAVNSSALGAERGATEARATEGTVTNTSAEPKYLEDGSLNPKFKFSKPTMIDFGVITERYGEAELIEQIAFPINWLEDQQYNWMLRKVAAITGRSREDLHNELSKKGSSLLTEWTGLLMSQSTGKEGQGKHPATGEFWGLPKFPQRDPNAKAPKPPRLGPPVRY